jgi:hypothetical protein
MYELKKKKKKNGCGAVNRLRGTWRAISGTLGPGLTLGYKGEWLAVRKYRNEQRHFRKQHGRGCCGSGRLTVVSAGG